MLELHPYDLWGRPMGTMYIRHNLQGKQVLYNYLHLTAFNISNLSVLFILFYYLLCLGLVLEQLDKFPGKSKFSKPQVSQH